MQILPINNVNSSQNINFRSCLRIYSPSKNPKIFSGKENIRTTTDFDRLGSNLSVLINYAMLHFSDKPKVNFYSLASSDCSEAYTCAIFLIEQFKKKIFGKYLPMNMIEMFQNKKFNKYFPIHASDIDSVIIDFAKKRRVNIKESEWNINKKIFKKYFKSPEKYVQVKNDNLRKDGLRSYRPINILQKAVDIKRSDILTELNKIKDEGNSVVICANVFPYLKNTYIDYILFAAKKNLKSGSLFVIGDFDFESGVQDKLKKYGFFNPMPEFRNIFQKK